MSNVDDWKSMAGVKKGASTLVNQRPISISVCEVRHIGLSVLDESS